MMGLLIRMLVVVSLVLIGSCYAPPPPPRPVVAPNPAPAPAPPVQPQANILQRIANQQSRINQGVSSGRLTPREARILQDNLNWIRSEYRRMMAKGGLTPRERQILENRLNQNDRMIRDKIHNPVRRLY